MARTRKTSDRNRRYFIADLERRIAAGEGDASWQDKLQARLAALLEG
jgi:hypothetical protein